MRMHESSTAACLGSRSQPVNLTRILTLVLSLTQEAIAARDQTNGYKLDRSHTFAVTLFDDFERYAKVPDEYQEPEAKPYQPTVRFK